jgi:hypothetical protein
MPVVRNFVRHTSPARLREYFVSKKIAVSGVDWSQDQAEVAKNVIRLVDHLSDSDRARLRIDAERICQMADEVGQAALLSVVENRATFDGLQNGIERSHWVYVNEPESFRHAEDIRYADQYRHGRNWSGYQVEAGIALATDRASLTAFKEKIKTLFGLGDKVKLELFERIVTDEEGRDVAWMQVMVYQEGMPDAYLEFEGEDIVSRIRRPVSEHAITYASETGVIEVVAARRERRDSIAKAFTEDLLKRPNEADTLPLRRYSLTPLLQKQPLDWDREDGIESVQVVMIKLKDLAGDGRIQLEVPARSEIGFYDYVDEHFGDRNPLTSGNFTPTQAQLSIRFYPENGSNRRKVLPVKITMPNGCDLRSRTERERLIGEKYLKRWGLLEEIA